MVAIVGGLNLYGRPMERLAFRYDRHEGIVRYIRVWHVYYHPTVMRMFCLRLNNFGWFVIPEAIEYNLILNTFHKMRIQISSSELSLTNYLCLRCFLYRSPPTNAAIFAF